MKKINNLFVLILVFAGIVALNSCKEENELFEFDLNEGISVNDGILTFTTVDLYDETIQLLGTLDQTKLDSWEDAYNFESLRASNKQEELVYEIGNTFASLLNPEKEIIIAGNYFQLNFEDRSLIKRKLSGTCDLKSADVGQTFNFDDDVDVFDDNPILKSGSSTNRCSKSGRIWVYINTLTDGHARYRLKLDRYLIIYHVRAEIEPLDYQHVQVSIYGNTSENRYNKRNDPGCVLAGNKNTGFQKNDLRWELYNGVKALSAHRFKVTFKAQSRANGSDLSVRVATLHCGEMLNCSDN